MKKPIYSLLILGLAVMASCGELEPAGGPDGFAGAVLSARFEDPAQSADTKAGVTSQGIVSWDEEDRIAVYTSEGAIKAFDCIGIDEGTATFSGVLNNGEEPQTLSVFPASAFKSIDGDIAVVEYPAEYVYAENAMLAPMAAMVAEGTLSFKQMGGMVRLSCDAVPSDAVAFYIEAPQRRITGTFDAEVAEKMSVEAEDSEEGNRVVVTMPAGTSSITFNVPVPVGAYPLITAGFLDSSDEVLLEWEVLENTEILRADMYVRAEPSGLVINGTVIQTENTRYGLISDSSTGKGIAGVPVTDGYTYTVTDDNGVYQFVADPLCRAVYPSIPGEYEIPVAEDGEPAFWKTAEGRNDFELAPRIGDWSEFSILGISDVHFFTRELIYEDVEMFPYENTYLPDMNDYISGLGNVIAINTGDSASDHTRFMAETRRAYAMIKQNGKTVPMFHAIGNHDFSNDLSLNSTYECSQDYFDVYGPTEYSINIGKAHIVFMNNVMFDGHSPEGYGKAMQCRYGITDEAYAWLEADLAQVQDKQDKMLIMCFHYPIFNYKEADGYENFDNIRAILKTFGESHIMSGHKHFNTRREFSNSWNGLNGRTSEEHNMLPLSSYWLNDYSNDGVPNGYHLFKISGNRMTEQHFKAVGKTEAESQFRIYDGSAEYHAPVVDETLSDKDGKLYFDWKTMFDNEGFDVDNSVIVRVFDAGTRALDCKVYYTQGGVRNEMTRVSSSHRDQWVFYTMWFYGWQNDKFPAVYHNGGPNQNFWYYELPSGTLSEQQGWKVEVELNGRLYESSVITR